jgi:cell division protein FtsZ
MGMGIGVGENRAQIAARQATSSPLLEVSMEGARGVLFNIIGGADLTMAEVDEASKIIHAAADPDANIIFGATIDESIHDQVRITLIATGFDEERKRLQQFVEKREMPNPFATSTQQTQASQSYQSPINTVVNDTTQPQQPEEEEEDIFDIPAFLRQRN